MRTKITGCAVLAAWTSVGSHTALADVHDSLRPALVYLRASGQLASGPHASEMVESNATGSLVSVDGLVLTVYHLVFDLGEVVPKTVTIEARIGEKTNPPKPASIVDWNANTDLMVLKLEPTIGAYPIVSASTKEYSSTDTIYTSGFPADVGVQYIKLSGNITSASGPGGYLWATSFPFQSGQSGSPVYDADGKVLGIVKGTEGPLGYIIPIYYADSLLAQIRLREIRDAMQDFEPLRKRLEWTGEINEATESFTLTYEKAVGGEPQVKTIDVAIVARGRKGNAIGEINPNATMRRNLTPTARSGVNGGVFVLPPQLLDVFEAYRVDAEFDAITEFRIDIVATMSDGSVLQPKRVQIER
jgi:S1-C subfamily serine protease